MRVAAKLNESNGNSSNGELRPLKRSGPSLVIGRQPPGEDLRGANVDYFDVVIPSETCSRRAFEKKERKEPR